HKPSGGLPTLLIGKGTPTLGLGHNQQPVAAGRPLQDRTDLTTDLFKVRRGLLSLAAAQQSNPVSYPALVAHLKALNWKGPPLRVDKCDDRASFDAKDLSVLRAAHLHVEGFFDGRASSPRQRLGVRRSAPSGDESSEASSSTASMQRVLSSFMTSKRSVSLATVSSTVQGLEGDSPQGVRSTLLIRDTAAVDFLKSSGGVLPDSELDVECARLDTLRTVRVLKSSTRALKLLSPNDEAGPESDCSGIKMEVSNTSSSAILTDISPKKQTRRSRGCCATISTTSCTPPIPTGKGGPKRGCPASPIVDVAHPIEHAPVAPTAPAAQPAALPAEHAWDQTDLEFHSWGQLSAGAPGSTQESDGGFYPEPPSAGMGVSGSTSADTYVGSIEPLATIFMDEESVGHADEMGGLDVSFISIVGAAGYVIGAEDYDADDTMEHSISDMQNMSMEEQPPTASPP
ncbi:hypothetical protein B484DRAFT_472507, partial [Ochromonadaceae sp. CCMP2298]